MNVEIVYFEGCPHWREVGARVSAAAAGLVDVKITYRRVTSDDEAAALPFAGSPTILVDGADAFDDAVPRRELVCRLYQTDAGLMGVPTLAQLSEALRRRQSID